MRVSHLQQHQRFVNDVEQRLYNMSRIQQELGTGLRLFQPSEDVVSANSAQGARSQLSSIAQYQRNIENGQGFVSAADSKLTSIVNLVNEIDALALSVDNDHVTPEDRSFAAQEMNQKLEALLEYANAQFGDKYLFGGHGTLRTPFLAERNDQGLIINVGTESNSLDGRIYRMIDKDESVAINVTGDRLFQPIGEENTASDLYYVIRNLRDTIANNNVPPEGQEDALSTHVLRENLDAIRNRIIEQQTYVGSLNQRLSNKLSELSAIEIDWTDRLEEAQGVEMTDLVSRLAVEEGVYNALVAIQSRVLSRSLIDYMG